MEPKYKITIPKPCHEDWNAMLPSEKGRFCSVCAKDVIDFTGWNSTKIQDYFAKNKGQNICGKFKNEQIDSINIQIPEQVLQNQINIHKMFLLALFISMGTTLFSCQNKNGDKQKINSIEVVEDTIETHAAVGVLLHTKDSLKDNAVQQPKPKIKQVIFKRPKTIKCSEVISNKDEKINNESNIVYEDNTVYGGVGIDIYPDCIGGIQKFKDYINENYIIPKKAKKLKGKIKASFVIEKDGALNDVVIIEDLGSGTGEEFIRVLKLSPKWYPAEEQGKKIRFHFESQIFMTTDTVHKIFNIKKVTSRIDSIEIKRITKFKD
jgi:hypothetical protein